MAELEKLKKIVGGSAPAIATALGGPLAGAVVGILAEVFGVSNDPAAVRAAIQKSDPETIKLNLASAEAAYKAAAEESITVRHQIDNHVRMMEMDYNRGLFYSWWRPAAGWASMVFWSLICLLVVRDLYFGVYTLFNYMAQILMAGAPLSALAGIYIWRKSDERVALASGKSNLAENLQDLIKQIKG